jgi:hypothetical protein
LGGRGALAWRPIAPLKLAKEQARAFLWTDDWFFNCPDRPRWRQFPLAGNPTRGGEAGAEAPSLRISNQVATLEMAKAEFEASWRQWLAWAKLEEAP